jgi:hypothetical protein
MTISHRMVTIPAAMALKRYTPDTVRLIVDNAFLLADMGTTTPVKFAKRAKAPSKGTAQHWLKELAVLGLAVQTGRPGAYKFTSTHSRASVETLTPGKTAFTPAEVKELIDLISA